MSKRKTIEEFIQESNIIHNNKYDYSNIKEYVSNKSMIHIECPIHGIFLQQAYIHHRGSGCPKCATITTKKQTQNKLEFFITESKKYKEHEFLDYSKFIYNGNKTKGIIICKKLDKDGKEHGEFLQTPNNHNHKKCKGKCPKCILELRELKKLLPKTKHKQIFNNIIKTTNCSKCGRERFIGDQCDHCKKEYFKKYRNTHKKEELEYRQKNKEILKQKRKIYTTKNKEILKEKNKILGEQYRKTHKNEIRQRQRDYFNKVLKYNPLYKLEKTLRRRILLAVKLQKTEKAYKSIELIECSIDFLINHLQQTAIQHGYTDFDILNYSGKDYHIDHIIPCASFDLTKPEEQKKCFNWSNLQILTAKENMLKSDTII